MEKANIILSETWLEDDIEKMDDILNDAIDEFVANDEAIVNIQVVTGNNGLSRFWIYTIPKEWQNYKH